MSGGGGRRLSAGFPKDFNPMDNDDESERHEAAQRAERDRLDKLRSPLCETPGHQRRVAKISDIEGMRLAQKGVSFPL